MNKSLEITDILRDLHKVSGFRISIHNTTYDEIYAYPRDCLPFCRTIQQDATIFQQCRDCDKTMFEQVRQTGEPLLYRCPQGLYEAIAPIYHYGVLSGFLMMGQVRNPDPRMLTHLKATALQVTRSPSVANELAEQIPVLEDTVAGAYLHLATVLAEYLTATNRIATAGGKLAESVAQYLQKNYASPLTLEQLASEFRYSNATLTKTFREEYDCTIFQYLRDVRLKAATKLLIGTRNSIKEIALSCGFPDQNYFSRIFTSQYGQSPTAYRASHT